MVYSKQIGYLLLGALLFGAVLAIALIIVQFVRSTTVTGPSATPTPSVKPQSFYSGPALHIPAVADGMLLVKIGDHYSTIAYS